MDRGGKEERRREEGREGESDINKEVRTV